MTICRPLFFRSAQLSPRTEFGNENVSQMYSNPMSIVEGNMYINLQWFKDYK